MLVIPAKRRTKTNTGSSRFTSQRAVNLERLALVNSLCRERLVARKEAFASERGSLCPIER